MLQADLASTCTLMENDGLPSIRSTAASSELQKFVNAGLTLESPSQGWQGSIGGPGSWSDHMIWHSAAIGI